jgi:hypothetical protein
VPQYGLPHTRPAARRKVAAAKGQAKKGQKTVSLQYGIKNVIDA